MVTSAAIPGQIDPTGLSGLSEGITLVRSIFAGADIDLAIQRGLVLGTALSISYLGYIFVRMPPGSAYWLLRRSRALRADADSLSLQAASAEGHAAGLRRQLDVLMHGHLAPETEVTPMRRQPDVPLLEPHLPEPEDMPPPPLSWTGRQASGGPQTNAPPPPLYHRTT